MLGVLLRPAVDRLYSIMPTSALYSHSREGDKNRETYLTRIPHESQQHEATEHDYEEYSSGRTRMTGMI